ncbi:hypothetical protein D3C73_1596600 [compost metagenome]
MFPSINIKIEAAPLLLISAIAEKATNNPTWFKAKAPTLINETVLENIDNIVSITSKLASIK